MSANRHLPTQSTKADENILVPVEKPDGLTYKVLHNVSNQVKSNAWKEILMLWQPVQSPPYGVKVAKALNKPLQVFGWDPVTYAFHWTDQYTPNQLKDYIERKKEANPNYFPPWSIDKDRECPCNHYLNYALHTEWDVFRKNSDVGYRTNSFDGDNPHKCYTYSVWSPKFHGGLQILRNLKLENPTWSNQKCWDKGIQILQEEIDNPNTLQTYWSKQLKTKEYRKAVNSIKNLKHININTEEKLTLMEDIMVGLNIRVCLDPRKNFLKLQKWCEHVPTNDQDTHKKTSFSVRKY
jgi:hypothetical protein